VNEQLNAEAQKKRFWLLANSQQLIANSCIVSRRLCGENAVPAL
jgi:hypothetical protein